MGRKASWQDLWTETISVDDEFLNRLQALNKKQLDSYKDDRMFEKRSLSYFQDDLTDLSLEDDLRCEGDIRLRRIFYLLDTIMLHKKWTREEAQIKLHKSYIIASLPIIYGSDWDIHQERILAKFKVKDLKSLVLALFPRRYGKTIAVACFIAVMLTIICGVTISTFSTGQRASGGMMDEVMRILSGHPDIVARIVKSTEEKLRISSTANGKKYATDVSTFNSYPSNPKGNIVHIFTHTCIQMFVVAVSLLFLCRNTQPMATMHCVI